MTLGRLEDAAGWLFQSGGFSPHAFCLAYDSFALNASRLGHRMIVVAYLTLGLQMLLGAVLHRKGLKLTCRRSGLALTLFGTFILSCGAGHLIMDLDYGLALYRLEGLWHVWTGAISLATCVLLPFLIKAEHPDADEPYDVAADTKG